MTTDKLTIETVKSSMLPLQWNKIYEQLRNEHVAIARTAVRRFGPTFDVIRTAQGAYRVLTYTTPAATMKWDRVDYDTLQQAKDAAQEQFYDFVLHDVYGVGADPLSKLQ